MEMRSSLVLTRVKEKVVSLKGLMLLFACWKGSMKNVLDIDDVLKQPMNLQRSVCGGVTKGGGQGIMGQNCS